MNNIYYSSEKNIQILIALLKAHNIRKIIVSPGSSNLYFVASIQNDNYFEVYSCIDERSASYMACGMAAEANEPVVISCTMATAGRNYLPGLTEAFYRKLSILALTATEPGALPGHHIQQVTDRKSLPTDVAKADFYVRTPHNEVEEWENNVKINKALIELRSRGGGPVHINFEMEKSLDFSQKNIRKERIIHYYSYGDKLPPMPNGKIGIFVGNHNKWSKRLTDAVDRFCEQYNAVVLVDQCSNYPGKYGVFFNLIYSQKLQILSPFMLDLLIHIGEVSASKKGDSIKVWRVNIDGQIRDTFKKLDSVFDMTEESFFEFYIKENNNNINTSFYDMWNEQYEKILKVLNESEYKIPFSNVWIANRLHKKLTCGSVLHLGILNSLRCWNYFKSENLIMGYANTGGFGIDGCVSSLIGASLIDSNKIYYGVFGDLAFFYDMNIIGNRHLGKNVRIMIVNNGLGFEFKQYSNDSQKIGMGNDANCFIAGGGHFGDKSKKLIKHYTEDMGFSYISASSKEEFLSIEDIYVNGNKEGKPILLEVFTEDADEAEALELIQTLQKDITSVTKKIIKSVIKR